MRTAAQSVSVVVFETNSLYEASFFIAIYQACLDDAAARRRAPATAGAARRPAADRAEPASRSATPAKPSFALHDVRPDPAPRRGDRAGRGERLRQVHAGQADHRALPARTGAGCAGTAWTPRSVDARELHDRVAVVLQDPVRWPMTAENNVRIGRLARPDPDSAHRDAAARDSGADTVVAELTAGWSTVLSREFQTGRDLSGGQWQRLSVARGLYRDAPLVIADEPTAALDARAEQAVFGTLHGRTGRRRGPDHRAGHAPAGQRALRRPDPGAGARPDHRTRPARRADGVARHLLRAVHACRPARTAEDPDTVSRMTELVHLEVADGVATITLDSPANRNALSRAAAPRAAGPPGHRDRRRRRPGDRAGHTGPVFCSGMDLKESRGAGAQDQGVTEFPADPGADLDLADAGAGPARRAGPGRRGRAWSRPVTSRWPPRTPRSRSARSGSGWCRRSSR